MRFDVIANLVQGQEQKRSGDLGP
jgi:hypothetical protein